MKVRKRKQKVCDTLALKVIKLRLYRLWKEYTERIKEDILTKTISHYQKQRRSVTEVRKNKLEINRRIRFWIARKKFKALLRKFFALHSSKGGY